MMLITKLVVVIVALAAGIKVIDCCVVWAARRRLEKLQKLKAPAPSRSSLPDALVVYYSRSGHTALASSYLANQLHADLRAVEAFDYSLGLAGWVNAMADGGLDDAWINPAWMDLAPYDAIYLGTPIWRGCPAPPAWEFVRSNMFPGKKVVLVTTSRGSWKQSAIELLGREIVRRGARSFEHRPLARKRAWFRRSDPDDLRITDLM